MAAKAKTYPSKDGTGVVDYGPKPAGHDGKWTRWGIDVFLHEGKGGRVRRRKYARKDEAFAAANELKDQQRQGVKIDATAGDRVGLTEVQQKFMEALPRNGRHAVGDRTRKDLEEVWRNVVRPKWEHYLIGRITYKGITAWANELAQSGRSPKRQKDGLALLGRILGHAVALGYLARNPAYDLNGKRDYMPAPAPQGPGKTEAKHALTARQLRRLAAVADDEQTKAMIMFAGTTGLRWQEWAALSVGDIDTDKGTVSVTKALSKTGAKDARALGLKGYELGPTKNKTTRTVPVLPEVLALLTPMLDQDDDHTLFTSARGNAIGQNQIGADMRKASALAGQRIARLQEEHGLRVTGRLDDKTHKALAEAGADLDGLQVGDEDFKPLTPHGLRHTAITGLILSGVPVPAVAAWAGHKSQNVTTTVYSHLYETSLTEAAKVQATWLGSDSDCQSTVNQSGQ